MKDIQERLITEAQKKFNQIYPCGSNQSLQECFTIENDMILFWFNTSDKSTHVLCSEF